jgi:asparagine synthase (glutamine-hydrolysing)
MRPLSYVALLSRQTTGRPEQLTGWTERLQHEHGLAMLFESPTLTVFGDPRQPSLQLPGGAGIIIGYVFERATGAHMAETSAALGGPAEALIEAAWGGYVVLRSRNATPEVVRDPSGAIPCYQAELEDVRIITSRPDLLFSAGLMQPEIDWSIIVQGLVYRDVKSTMTALRGISEIMPGTAARLYPTGLETRCVWNPWHFVSKANPWLTSEEAVEMVRAAVDACITAWAGCFSHAIVEISGGLDSAIVAACVASTNMRATGITYAAIGGDLDETPYADAIARHLAMPLEVGRPDIASGDLGISDAAGLPRPCARSFSQPFDRIALALAKAQRADVFFSGGGGDNVFSYQRSLSPAIDRLRSPGPIPGAWTTICDLAQLGETSVWHVAGRVLRRMLRPPASPWRADRGFLGTAVLENVTFPCGHPWIEIPEGALPGKIMHVASLVRVQGHLEGHHRQHFAPIISPLLAQPVMEACLAIPSWLWCAGGRNRAVARDAFASRLPATVVARQSKGAFDSFSAQLFSANRQWLRDLLLGGHLASRDLLDVAGIEKALTSQTASSMPLVELWSLIDAEAWLRSWSGAG